MGYDKLITNAPGLAKAITNGTGAVARVATQVAKQTGPAMSKARDSIMAGGKALSTRVSTGPGIAGMLGKTGTKLPGTAGAPPRAAASALDKLKNLKLPDGKAMRASFSKHAPTMESLSGHATSLMDAAKSLGGSKAPAEPADPLLAEMPFADATDKEMKSAFKNPSTLSTIGKKATNFASSMQRQASSLASSMSSGEGKGLSMEGLQKKTNEFMKQAQELVGLGGSGKESGTVGEAGEKKPSIFSTISAQAKSLMASMHKTGNEGQAVALADGAKPSLSARLQGRIGSMQTKMQEGTLLSSMSESMGKQFDKLTSGSFSKKLAKFGDIASIVKDLRSSKSEPSPGTPAQQRLEHMDKVLEELKTHPKFQQHSNPKLQEAVSQTQISVQYFREMLDMFIALKQSMANNLAKLKPSSDKPVGEPAEEPPAAAAAADHKPATPATEEKPAAVAAAADHKPATPAAEEQPAAAAAAAEHKPATPAAEEKPATAPLATPAQSTVEAKEEKTKPAATPPKKPSVSFAPLPDKDAEIAEGTHEPQPSLKPLKSAMKQPAPVKTETPKTETAKPEENLLSELPFAELSDEDLKEASPGPSEAGSKSSISHPAPSKTGVASGASTPSRAEAGQAAFLPDLTAALQSVKDNNEPPKALSTPSSAATSPLATGASTPGDASTAASSVEPSPVFTPAESTTSTAESSAAPTPQRRDSMVKPSTYSPVSSAGSSPASSVGSSPASSTGSSPASSTSSTPASSTGTSPSVSGASTPEPRKEPLAADSTAVPAAPKKTPPPLPTRPKPTLSKPAAAAASTPKPAAEATPQPAVKKQAPPVPFKPAHLRVNPDPNISALAELPFAALDEEATAAETKTDKRPSPESKNTVTHPGPKDAPLSAQDLAEIEGKVDELLGQAEQESSLIKKQDGLETRRNDKANEELKGMGTSFAAAAGTGAQAAPAQPHAANEHDGEAGLGGHRAKMDGQQADLQNQIDAEAAKKPETKSAIPPAPPLPPAKGVIPPAPPLPPTKTSAPTATTTATPAKTPAKPTGMTFQEELAAKLKERAGKSESTSVPSTPTKTPPPLKPKPDLTAKPATTASVIPPAPPLPPAKGVIPPAPPLPTKGVIPPAPPLPKATTAAQSKPTIATPATPKPTLSLQDQLAAELKSKVKLAEPEAGLPEEVLKEAREKEQAKQAEQAAKDKAAADKANTPEAKTEAARVAEQRQKDATHLAEQLAARGKKMNGGEDEADDSWE